MEYIKFAKTEVLELMNENTANSLRLIVCHARKYDFSVENLTELMEECADELEAQIQVYKVRDMINKK